MPSVTYASGTVIGSTWLNEINNHVFNDTAISPKIAVHGADKIGYVPSGIAAWVSGTSYSVGNLVKYANNSYKCILAVSGTTIPSSDATHWTPLSKTTATKFAEVIDVTDYGAVGDGTTDCTTPIQLALNAANSSTTVKTVYIPPGTYLISSTLNIYSNTMLVGDNKETTTLKGSSLPSTSKILTNANGGTGAINTYNDSNIIIKGICFDANNVSGRQAGGVEFLGFSHVSNFLFTENKVQNVSYIGLAFSNTQYVFVTNCEFYNTGSPTVTSEGGAALWAGTYAGGFNRYLSVRNNWFHDLNWSACYFMPTFGVFDSNLVVNTRESAVFSSETTTYAQYTNNIISGTTKKNISASGMEVSGTALLIKGNFIYGAANDGISITDAQDVLVTDNVIMSNGTDTASYPYGAGIGLYCLAPSSGGLVCKYITIKNNRIGDRQGVPTQYVGFLVFPRPGSTPMTDILFSDNNCQGQRVSGWSIDATLFTSGGYCVNANNYDHAGVLQNQYSTSSGTAGEVFRAHGTGATSITLATWQKVVFDTTDFDPNSRYSVADNRFTAGYTGYYQINANVEVLNVTGQGSLFVALYKNGALHTLGTNNLGPTTALGLSGVLSTVVNATVGDYFEVFVYVNSSAAVTQANGTTYACTFSGAKLAV